MSRHLPAARARLVASLLAVSGLVTACGTSTGLVDAEAPPGERPLTEPAVWPEGVETFEVSSNRHVEGDIDYDRSPPAGGDHSNVWQNCGIYDEPVEDGQAVHSLEHGAVWITYRPDLPDEQVQRLHDLVGSGGYVLSIVGGIGGSITILSYNYWMREEHISGADNLGYVRRDVGVAYLFTAIFGMSVMLIADQAFFVPGVKITDAQAVPQMAETLGTMLGPFGRYAYSVGFWAAVFASLLGVWQSVPYLYADFYGVLTGLPPERRKTLTKGTSTPYRLALLFLTLAPLPFAFTGRPLGIIVAYTIIGSLFIPFLAATLLYLNNRVRWASPVPRNHWSTNAVLWTILGLFVVVGVQEVWNALF